MPTSAAATPVHSPVSYLKLQLELMCLSDANLWTEAAVMWCTVRKLVWQHYSLAESWSHHHTGTLDIIEYKSDPGLDISTGLASHNKEKFVLTELVLEIPAMWKLGFPSSAKDQELFH